MKSEAVYKKITNSFFVVFFLFVFFVEQPTTVAFAFFGSTSATIDLWDTLRTSLQSAWHSADTTLKQYQWVITDLQSTDRTLVALQDMYYMLQAFRYLHDNGGFLGAMNYMSQATSMATGMAGLGMTAYQGIASTGALGPGAAISPQDYAADLNNMAVASSTFGQIASSAQTFSMIGNENSGVPFLEVVNGAQLGVSATLGVGNAILNLHSYMAQKDQQEAMQTKLQQIRREQSRNALAPQTMTVACLNRPAYISMAATSRFITGVQCSQQGAPQIVYGPPRSTGTGIAKNIQTINQNAILNSAAANAAAGVPPASLPPPPPTFTPPQPAIGSPSPTVGLSGGAIPTVP